jgi:hypothetical protein
MMYFEPKILFDYLFPTSDADKLQAALVLLQGLADFGNTLFVDTITGICKLAKVRVFESCMI